mgnify:CR=1 FL=1
MVEESDIEQKLDGEEFAVYMGLIEPSDLNAMELLEHIVSLESILSSNRTINLINKMCKTEIGLTTDSEVYLMVAKSNLQKFYDEFDSRGYE